MPAGAALGVFPLAAEFGWSIEYILWGLPLVIFNQAHGWIMWKNGIQLRRVRQDRVKRDDIEKNLGI